MKKTFAILLAVLLTLALLICACSKDDVNGDDTGSDANPAGTSDPIGTDIDPAASESESDSDSESEEETIPVVYLGTQKRPEQTVTKDDESEGTEFRFDSSQMTPDEEQSYARDSAYWDSQLGGAGADNQ